MRSFEKFVFSYDPENMKISLLQVVVFLSTHLYPSWVVSDCFYGSFLGGIFPLVRVRATLLSGLILKSRLALEPPTMEWTTPQHEEIDLNCEISSYANAEL
jgi:hypothetical protein